MRKFCFVFAFALLVCAGSSFALSPDDSIDNSLDSAPVATVGDYMLDAVSYAASSAGWTDTDHDWLNQIRLALTQSNTGSIRGYLQSLDSDSDKILTKLIDIKSSTDYLPNISNNTNDSKTLLGDAKSLLDKIQVNTGDYQWNKWQSSIVTHSVQDFYSDFSFIFSQATWPSFDGGTYTPNATTFSNLLGNSLIALGYDVNLFNGERSLYGRIKQLQETLASDEDKALSDAQKANRDQIQQDFVSGSSGKTSLGASDFGDLSSVGGSVKDSISLNGQSSISGFTGGLSDADDAGQGWFSANTRDALDTVSSSSSSSSSRARRAPDDTYNMAGFAENYSWLYGE